MEQPPEEYMVGDVRVELVDSMGNDLSVVKAARVSTMGERVQVGHGEKGSRGLINYLMRERHGSPFAHNRTEARREGKEYVSTGGSRRCACHYNTKLNTEQQKRHS